MTYCNSGDTPKVHFQFNNQAQQIYQANVSPINVTSGNGPISSSPNYNALGYQITVQARQSVGIYVLSSFLCIDYILVPTVNPDNLAQTAYYFNVTKCNGLPYFHDGNGNTTLGIIILPGITIDNSIHCPPGSSNNNICSINISSIGNTLFQAQGACPISFQVACSSNCPDNTIECSCPNYPGYCCLDCGSIEGQVSQLINQVKSLS